MIGRLVAVARMVDAVLAGIEAFLVRLSHDTCPCEDHGGRR